MASLLICICALTLAICFSKGFSDQIRLKLSSIDGHYRITSLYHNYNNYLHLEDVNNIASVIEQDSRFLSYSDYTEDYALANISGKSEGLLIYGVDPNKALDIFDIDISVSEKKINYNDSSQSENINFISIGSKLARNHNLEIGDHFFIFPIDIENIDNLPIAEKFQIVNIFNSGFSEYDESVCFIDLQSSRSLFNYGSKSRGIIGVVKNPLHIDRDFDDIFKNIEGYRITTWMDRHQSMVTWLDAYSDPIIFIIFSITILAILNMSLSLWILTQDRLKEIAILLTIGFTKIKIFLSIVLQNTILTFVSIIFAGLLSVLILYFQYRYQLIKISEDIYFINYLPVSIDYVSILNCYGLLFLISFLISFFPAWKLYSLNIIEYINSDD